jgi:glutamine synthetase
MAQVVDAPTSLDQSLKALEADHDFLLRGDVFSADFIGAYTKYKHENEVLAVSVRPHPLEFAMYFDG